MQPGGKIETGEEPVAALCRELSEELGLSVDPLEPQYLGLYSAPAANETGSMVVADIFRIDVNVRVTPAAEIEEISWVDPKRPAALTVAPLTRDHVFPLLTASVKGSKGTTGTMG
jgi:8-oxo-dGTP pyrophosphatase MutT (NUDIX family)